VASLRQPLDHPAFAPPCVSPGEVLPILLQPARRSSLWGRTGGIPTVTSAASTIPQSRSRMPCETLRAPLSSDLRDRLSPSRVTARSHAAPCAPCDAQGHQTHQRGARRTMDVFDLHKQVIGEYADSPRVTHPETRATRQSFEDRITTRSRSTMKYRGTVPMWPLLMTVPLAIVACAKASPAPSVNSGNTDGAATSSAAVDRSRELAQRQAEQARLDSVVAAAQARVRDAIARESAARENLTSEEPTYAVARYNLDAAQQRRQAVEAEATTAATQAENYRRFGSITVPSAVTTNAAGNDASAPPSTPAPTPSPAVPGPPQAARCIYPSHSVFHLRATPVNTAAGAEQVTTRPRMEVLRSTTIRRGREAMYYVHFLDDTDRRGWMFIPVFELAHCTPGSMPLIATDGLETLPDSTVSRPALDAPGEGDEQTDDNSPSGRCLSRCRQLYQQMMNRCMRAPPLAAGQCMQSANGTLDRCINGCVRIGVQR